MRRASTAAWRVSPARPRAGTAFLALFREARRPSQRRARSSAGHRVSPGPAVNVISSGLPNGANETMYGVYLILALPFGGIAVWGAMGILELTRKKNEPERTTEVKPAGPHAVW